MGCQGQGFRCPSNKQEGACGDGQPCVWTAVDYTWVDTREDHSPYPTPEQAMGCSDAHFMVELLPCNHLRC